MGYEVYYCKCGKACHTEFCPKCGRKNTDEFYSLDDSDSRNEKEVMSDWSRNDVDKFVNGY